MVVLPAPLGPSRENTSPRLTSKSMPSTAVMSGYRFTRPRTSITCSPTARHPRRTDIARRHGVFGLVVHAHPGESTFLASGGVPPFTRDNLGTVIK